MPDGNDLLADDLPALISLVARTSLWVAPEIFRALPVWAPWTARGAPLFRKAWSEAATNTRKSTGETLPKHEGNVAAIDALTRALGVPRPRPKNWTVCHIWGYDDPRFAESSSATHDHRFFSCVANMIWLPTPLKGLTDALPQVKAVLRACAAHLYGWHGPALGQSGDTPIPSYYPADWPRPETPELRPVGVRPLTVGIAAEIGNRKRRIATDLRDQSLLNYPRQRVQEVLEYWQVDLEAPVMVTS